MYFIISPPFGEQPAALLMVLVWHGLQTMSIVFLQALYIFSFGQGFFPGFLLGKRHEERGVKSGVKVEAKSGSKNRW